MLTYGLIVLEAYRYIKGQKIDQEVFDHMPLWIGRIGEDNIPPVKPAPSHAREFVYSEGQMLPIPQYEMLENAIGVAFTAVGEDSVTSYMTEYLGPVALEDDWHHISELITTDMTENPTRRQKSYLTLWAFQAADDYGEETWWFERILTNNDFANLLNHN